MLQHRYGHLFRSDSHSRAMDAIADAIDASSKDEHRETRTASGRISRQLETTLSAFLKHFVWGTTLFWRTPSFELSPD
jgi:hypothetical protein